MKCSLGISNFHHPAYQGREGPRVQGQELTGAWKSNLRARRFSRKHPKRENLKPVWVSSVAAWLLMVYKAGYTAELSFI